MKLSEYIKSLELLLEQGDTEVMTQGRIEVVRPPKPSRAHLRIKQGRERNLRIYQSWDTPESKGEIVVLI